MILKPNYNRYSKTIGLSMSTYQDCIIHNFIGLMWTPINTSDIFQSFSRIIYNFEHISRTQNLIYINKYH